MRVPDAIKDRRGVVIDTNVFIYLFENDPRFGAIGEFILQRVEQGAFHAVVTPITVAEVITKPLSLHRMDIADRCRSALRRLDRYR